MPRKSPSPSKAESESAGASDPGDSTDEEPPPPNAREAQKWKLPLSCEQLLTALSFRPRVIRDMSLRVPRPQTPKPLKRKIQSSSLGKLDLFPAEILHNILLMSDIRSVARISQVSVLGKQIVGSLPLLQELKTYAGSALGALGATGLAGEHSINAIYSAFQTPDYCVSCWDMAPFLLLPTLERCCYECLARNPALQCMPLKLAMMAFGLTESQVRSLPVLHTIGDYEYPLSTRVFDGGPIELVSMKMAKILARDTHGSWEAVQRCLPKKPSPRKADHFRADEGVTWARWLLMRRAQNAPLEPLGRNPSMEALRQEWLGSTSHGYFGGWYVDWEDDFAGTSSVIFPYLQSGTVPKKSYFCRGCAWVFYHWENETLRPSVDLPNGVPMKQLLLGRARRAYSKDGFIAHLRKCEGARIQIMGLIQPSSKISRRNHPGKHLIRDAIGKKATKKRCDPSLEVAY